LDAVANAEFGQDPGDVGADGGLADHQRGGDLGVGKSSCDRPEDVDLARGQFAEGGWDGGAGGWAVDELLDEPASDVGGEEGIAGGDVALTAARLAGRDPGPDATVDPAGEKGLLYDLPSLR
jgi:hypothetical protein